MRQLLIKAATPLVAGALVLASLSGAAFANAKHQATTTPTYAIAYEGPLSGGNAQLGLNMAVRGRVRRPGGELREVGFRQASLHAHLRPQGRPGLGHAFADRRRGARVQQERHRSCRPGFLGCDQGGRADLQREPRGDCQPVGDTAGAGHLRMEELLPGRRGRRRAGAG